MSNHHVSRLALAALVLSLSACDYLPRWMGGADDRPPPLPGERFAVLPVESELTPDPALKAMPVTAPAAFANADWPQHSGVVGSANGNLAGGGFDSETSARVGDGNSYEHTLVAQPIVGEGLVFVMDSVGNISAHDAGNVSNVRWQSKGLAEEDEPDVMGGGLAYHQGKVYGVSGRGMVAAWEAASGKELWHVSMRIPFRSAPRIVGDKLVAVTIDSQTYAFNIANGQAIWNQRGIDETAELMNSLSPAAMGDTVIVPYGSGEIYALSAADGRELWSDMLALNRHTQASSLFTGIGGDPVIDGEVVFAISSSGPLSVLHLSRGQRVWERKIASENTPWVSGNFLYVLTADDTLVCFVKYDGRIRWATKLPSFEDEENKRRPIVWRGPIMVNGNLAVVGSRGEMKLVSAADGNVVATKSIPSDVYTAPVVAGGRLYLVTQNATLHSLQ